MFEATRLPEISYLLFFFHVDVIDSEIVSLGFYNINQQTFVSPVKLHQLSEEAKKLGFVSKTSYSAKHIQGHIDCKDEKTALVHFLSTIENYSQELKYKPVLVSLTTKKEVYRLFQCFESHGLLQRAFKVITALGSIEEFWARTEGRSFSGIEDILRELQKTQMDISTLNSVMISKLCLDFLTNKLNACH